MNETMKDSIYSVAFTVMLLNMTLVLIDPDIGDVVRGETMCKLVTHLSALYVAHHHGLSAALHFIFCSYFLDIYLKKS